MSPASAAGASNATSLAFSVLLMYALNGMFGWTFPPEVSSSFTSVVALGLTILCHKTKLCDLDGDGRPDLGGTK